MNQKKVFADLFWETAGSALIAAATHSLALPAQFPMTGFQRHCYHFIPALGPFHRAYSAGYWL